MVGLSMGVACGAAVAGSGAGTGGGAGAAGRPGGGPRCWSVRGAAPSAATLGRRYHPSGAAHVAAAAQTVTWPKSRAAGAWRGRGVAAAAGGGDDGIPDIEKLPQGGGGAVATLEEFTPPSDLSYLQELLAIQDNGPRRIAFFGTRNMGITHQRLVEILAYAMMITGNEIFTSGSTGTNLAVIKGALRAIEKESASPGNLTVILPQSLAKQPAETQEILIKVREATAAVIEMPENDELKLAEASRLCNRVIIERASQMICFAFHDSERLLETANEAKLLNKVVTLFYLD